MNIYVNKFLLSKFIQVVLIKENIVKIHCFRPNPISLNNFV